MDRLVRSAPGPAPPRRSPGHPPTHPQLVLRHRPAGEPRPGMIQIEDPRISVPVAESAKISRKRSGNFFCNAFEKRLQSTLYPGNFDPMRLHPRTLHRLFAGAALTLFAAMVASPGKAR